LFDHLFCNVARCDFGIAFERIGMLTANQLNKQAVGCLRVSSTCLVGSNCYPIKKLCHFRQKLGHFHRHRQTGDLFGPATTPTPRLGGLLAAFCRVGWLHLIGRLIGELCGSRRCRKFHTRIRATVRSLAIARYANRLATLQNEYRQSPTLGRTYTR
jgi:hypothetical protein